MKAAVVTGATGALGEAVVDEFLARGTAVVAMGRSSDRLTELGTREGVYVVAVDLAQRAAEVGDAQDGGLTGDRLGREAGGLARDLGRQRHALAEQPLVVLERQLRDAQVAPEPDMRTIDAVPDEASASSTS